MMSNHQDPLRPMFESWAADNLPRSYSLAMKEGDYDEKTRVAFSAFKAGLKQSDGFGAGMERAAVICDSLVIPQDAEPYKGTITALAAAIRAEAASIDSPEKHPPDANNGGEAIHSESRHWPQGTMTPSTNLANEPSDEHVQQLGKEQE
jgi:hypothetical protein